MAVEIDVKVETLSVFLLEVLGQFDQVVGFGKGKATALVERAVEISAEERSPVVSHHHPVWI
jgi:hypothetical protein